MANLGHHMVEWIGREELGNSDVVTVTYTSNRRYCGGLTVAETPAALDVSADTVMRDWNVARAWLKARISR
jgi:ECF sigma factor